MGSKNEKSVVTVADPETSERGEAKAQCMIERFEMHANSLFAGHET